MASEANEPGSEHPARSPRIVRRSRHAYSYSLLGSEPVALQLVPERALADAEQFRRPHLVVVHGAESPEDELSLHLGHGVLKQQALRHAFRARRRPSAGRACKPC